MTTTLNKTTASGTDRQASRKQMARKAVRQVGAAVHAVASAALFVLFFPVVALAYLAVWLDRSAEEATENLGQFAAPRQPR